MSDPSTLNAEQWLKSKIDCMKHEMIQLRAEIQRQKTEITRHAANNAILRRRIAELESVRDRQECTIEKLRHELE